MASGGEQKCWDLASKSPSKNREKIREGGGDLADPGTKEGVKEGGRTGGTEAPPTARDRSRGKSWAAKVWGVLERRCLGCSTEKAKPLSLEHILFEFI